MSATSIRSRAACLMAFCVACVIFRLLYRLPVVILHIALTGRLADVAIGGVAILGLLVCLECGEDDNPVLLGAGVAELCTLSPVAALMMAQVPIMRMIFGLVIVLVVLMLRFGHDMEENVNNGLALLLVSLAILSALFGFSLLF